MAGERTLPGLGLKAYWTLGSNGYKPDMDANFLALSALVQPTVLSSVAAVPGSPTDGDMHRLTGGANDLQIAVRDNGAWTYFVPAEGWLIYDQGANDYLSFDGAAWAVFAGGGAASATPYDVRTAFVATPGDAEVIDRLYMVRDVTFPLNFGGSVGAVQTNPTASYVLSVKDGATTIGTITVATGGGLTFATTGGTEKVVSAGSVLSFESQATADASVAGGGFSLKGSTS